MSKLDLQAWVDAEPESSRREFRQAVHLILRAIARSEKLAPIMVMKGGILLGIRYQSSRFTKDVDFSTQQKLQDVDLPTFASQMKQALELVSIDNDYGLAIALQSHALNPKREDSLFATLQMKIGYANRAIANEVKRLNSKQSAKAVQIDYSFNEWASDVEVGEVDGGTLAMYAYHDLIAEKLRSVLQQPIRNRARFQDIYDLCLLLDCIQFNDEDRSLVLRKLMAASEDRKVPMDPTAMRSEQLRELSKREYPQIVTLIAAVPPAFDVAYGRVQAFYESLPWRV
ncbi:nucleotidyl transferase AbiEii/AbiGii toxin family protein [Paucibacter sp. PLA-PC-4]|uniref:nucleotidyl transferase AbiEii/AbiGii toxin family protein n=1 Tax=Paucibacter sp. PLA-PC-4 TaxID=2993655 RepID=UPI00224B6361|nr:nucleotidyl transferase AbiEii/AbiGii toxin family protein [Paucibacter sp. PLA-PC-4]MCX2865468.1 nucleotidyl transferase AbiEii/AbiGii toxin family protein [Paucibacter sp. PLA-PC-4]